MAPRNARPADDDDGTGTVTRTLRLRRFVSPIVALSGVLLLVSAARVASSDRRRAGLLSLSSGGLLAAWVRRHGPPEGNDPEAPTVPGGEASGPAEGAAEAAASHERPEILTQNETDTRCTASEPDVDDVSTPDVDETDDWT